MTLPALRHLCSVWRDRLNLQDWTITVRWAKPDEIADQWATCNPRGDHGRASIVIHRHIEHHEFWMVHELGHVVLCGLLSDTATPAETMLEERAINRYARALCEAYGVSIPESVDGAE